MNGAGFGHDEDTYLGNVPEAEEEAVDLAEELADTTTIEQLFDTYIGEVQELLAETLEVSLEANPVRTHLELAATAQDVVELAYQLRSDLLAKVANRAEQIDEQHRGTGAILVSAPSSARKQVLENDKPSPTFSDVVPVFDENTEDI
jgi:hypothetical protein